MKAVVSDWDLDFMFYFFMSQYLFCEKSNRRLWFNDTWFFFICQSKECEAWQQGRLRPCIFLLNYTLNLSCIYIFLYNFCQKWLMTPCSFLFCLVYICIVSYQKWRVGIPLAGLSQPHFCTCPKPGPGLPISWYLLRSVISVKMKSDTVIVRFVDVSWNTELMTITA